MPTIFDKFALNRSFFHFLALDHQASVQIPPYFFSTESFILQLCVVQFTSPRLSSAISFTPAWPWFAALIQAAHFSNFLLLPLREISTFLKQLQRKMPKDDKRSLGRANRSVVESLSPEEQQSTWDTAQGSLDPPNALGCRLWNGSTQNGYPSISRGHGQSKIKVHMLAISVARGRLPGPSEVCSHLCHEKRCCNPDHIVIESIVANSKRNGCLHSLNTAPGQTWILCPHLPLCMQPDRSNIREGFAPYLLAPQPPTA